MSDASNSATGSGTSAIPAGETTITIDPATNRQAAAPAAPPPAQAGEPNEKPSWLDARLERERKQVLKDLGIDSLDAGKSAIAAAKEAAEAKKTDAQKAADSAKALESTSSELARAKAAVSEYAKTLMTGLTDAQKAAVNEVAGEDAALQIKTVNALRPTWASMPAPAAAVVQNTLPAKGTPSDSGTATSAPDPKAIHAELKKTNPYFAARYAVANGIYASA